MRRRLSYLLLCALLLGGETTPSAAPAGTLDSLVQDLDGKVDLALQGRTLRRCDLALALGAGSGVTPRLVQAVRGLVVGRMTRKGLRTVGELPRDGDSRQRRRRARAGGYELLLDLELLVVEGHLHVRGELAPVDRVLWRDIVQPDRGALSHLSASVRVDAEVRSYLGQPVASIVRFSPHSMPLGKDEALALAAGDVDGDGRTEVAVLHLRSLQLLRQRSGGGFATVHTAKLGQTAAASRPRRAHGSLLVGDVDGDGKNELLVRSSELERCVELAWDGRALVARRELDGFPLTALPAAKGRAVVFGRMLPGQDLFSAAALTTLPPLASVPEWQKGLPSSFYALRHGTVAARGGRQHYIAVVDGSGAFSVFLGDQGTPLLTTRAGAAFDLVDLDDDGALEIIASGVEGPDVEDQIVVSRLTRAGQLRLVWRSAGLGGQVVDVAHGDLDGNGKLEVVALIRQRGGAVTLMVLN